MAAKRKRTVIFSVTRERAYRDHSMAHPDIVKVTNGPGTRNLIFYNVYFPVSKNCPNKTEDALLVQYLLKESLKIPSFSYISGTAMAGAAQEGATENLIVTSVWDERWPLYPG
jgi:hypothetical protein